MIHRRHKYAILSVGLISLLAAAGGCRARGAQASARGAAEATRAAASAPANQVLIDNFTFNPPTLTVDVGAEVTWINRDDVPHTVTSSAKPRAFASGALDTDQHFSHVFDTPGTFPYFCAIHPHMTAQIIVKPTQKGDPS